MDPSWTDIVTAMAAVLAVAAAAGAWTAALTTLRTSYRPVVRVAPTFQGGGLINPSPLILKNVGFGPALSVMLFEAREIAGEPLGSAAIVEVLGDGADERHRHGRVQMDVPTGLQNTRAYRLIYQDVAGNWHETRFTARQRELAEVRLMGQLRLWHVLSDRSRMIPKSVRVRGNVIRAPETV